MYFQMFFNYDDGDQMHINVNMHYLVHFPYVD